MHCGVLRPRPRAAAGRCALVHGCVVLVLCLDGRTAYVDCHLDRARQGATGRRACMSHVAERTAACNTCAAHDGAATATIFTLSSERVSFCVPRVIDTVALSRKKVHTLSTKR